MRNGTTWTQQAYLKGSNTDVRDQFNNSAVGLFGNSVAVSGDTIVVGANGENSNATGVNGDQNNNNAYDAGAAYVFVRNGTTWTQQAYLKASNTEADDQFGWSVALAGDTAVVGAYFEDSSATGVDGNQNTNNAVDSGAAYVFVRNGTTWTQQAYLKASNTEASDNFGYSVAVAGDTVVVGAAFEDSNATGVNGLQSNNSSGSAGAAYVFTGAGSGAGPVQGPRLSIVPDGAAGYFIRFNGTPGLSYQLLRALNVAGPWITNATPTAPLSGLTEYHETSPPPGSAFYRTAQP